MAQEKKSLVEKLVLVFLFALLGVILVMMARMEAHDTYTHDDGLYVVNRIERFLGRVDIVLTVRGGGNEKKCLRVSEETAKKMRVGDVVEFEGGVWVRTSRPPLPR